jgi:hypothetical protein
MPRLKYLVIAETKIFDISIKELMRKMNIKLYMISECNYISTKLIEYFYTNFENYKILIIHAV